MTPGRPIWGSLGHPHPHQILARHTCISQQRFKKYESPDWCQQHMKSKLVFSLPLWRKDIQAMPDPIVKLKAGPGETKQGWVWKVIREMWPEKGRQGLLNTGYSQLHLAQEGPKLQMVRAGNGLWPVLFLCQPSRRLASMDF